jgi:hypothetical protein
VVTKLRTATEADAVAEAARADQPKTIKGAADHSERALLVALRTNLAEQLDAGVPSHTLAALVKQLREVDHAIRAIDSRDGDDDIGDAAGTPDAKFRPEAL